MIEVLWSCFELFSNLWDQFLFLYLVDHHLPNNYITPLHKGITVFTFFGMLTIMQRLGLSKAAILLVMFAVYLFYTIYLRQGSLMERCAWPFVTMVTFFLIDQGLSIFMSGIPGFDYEVLLTRTPQRFLVVCFYIFLTTVAFLLLVRIRPRNRSLPRGIQIVSLIMSVIGVFLSGVVVDLSPGVTEDQSAWLLNLVTVGFMLMSIAWLFILDMLSARNAEFYSLQLEHQRTESERHNAEAQQVLFDRLRVLRHDFLNQMLSLTRLVQQGDLQGLSEHLALLNAEVKPLEFISLTNHPQLDALLSVKLQQATNIHIKTEVFFVVPGELPMSVVDLCSVMGNILDNALEAVQKVSEDKRFLELHANTVSGMWRIKVSNSCTGYYRRDTDNRLLTTKSESWHGIGLRRIKQLVERYDGSVTITDGEDTFTIDILLPCSR